MAGNRDFNIVISLVNYFKKNSVCSISQAYLVIEPFSYNLKWKQFEKCPLTEGQTLVPECGIEINNFHYNSLMRKNVIVLNTLNNKAEYFILHIRKILIKIIYKEKTLNYLLIIYVGLLI